MKPGRERNSFYAAIVSAAIVSTVYLSFPQHRYFVDGLNDAGLLETSSSLMTHSHHPLWPLIPQIFFNLSHNKSGLEYLSIWAIGAGILSCAIFAWLMAMLGLRPLTVVACVFLFSFSAGVWYFSSTANQYSTALFFHVLTLLFLFLYEKQVREGITDWRILIAASICASIAILFHQVNTLLLFGMMYVFSRRKARISTRMPLNFISLAIAVFMVIFMTIFCAMIIEGVASVPDFIAWQKSYVSNPWYWAHGFMDSILRSFHGAIELHLAHSFNPEGLFGQWIAAEGTVLPKIGQLVVLVFFVFIALKSMLNWSRRNPRLPHQTLGLVTALPFIIFSFFFTPETANYRIFYLPGIFLLIASTIETQFELGKPSLRRMWPIVLIIVSLFGTNFTLKFLPGSDPENNPYRSEAIRLRGAVGPGDLVIFSSGPEGYLRSTYTRYFARAETMEVHELVPELRKSPEIVLDKFREIAAAGGKIAIHYDALKSADELKWANRYYGLDIHTKEIEDLFHVIAQPTYGYNINEKMYIEIEPDEEFNEPPSD